MAESQAQSHTHAYAHRADTGTPNLVAAELPGGTRSLGVKRGQVDPAARGRTTIADGVVAKIAATAARDVAGVHAMGGGTARAVGTSRDRVPAGARTATRGVRAEVGEVQTALDLELVVEYGVPITEVCRTVRENVIAAVERMTGLEVVEVNIDVVDVRLPDEDDDQRQPLQ